MLRKVSAVEAALPVARSSDDDTVRRLGVVAILYLGTPLAAEPFSRSETTLSPRIPRTYFHLEGCKKTIRAADAEATQCSTRNSSQSV